MNIFRFHSDKLLVISLESHLAGVEEQKALLFDVRNFVDQLEGMSQESLLCNIPFNGKLYLLA